MRRPPMRAEQAGWIKWIADNTGLKQDQVAAALDLNQGRVCEVLTGRRFPGEPARLPPLMVLANVHRLSHRPG